MKEVYLKKTVRKIQDLEAVQGIEIGIMQNREVFLTEGLEVLLEIIRIERKEVLLEIMAVVLKGEEVTRETAVKVTEGIEVPL